jgi:bifunctional DNase/RNase
MKNFTITVGVTIAFFFVLPFLFGQEIAAKVTSPPIQFQKDLLEVKVYSLIVDPSSMQPVVLLAAPSGELVMPIWIGPNEAAAIQGELEGTKPPRPMTHDLLERVIQRLNGTVRRVTITQEKEGIYYAIIVLEKDRTLLELDARPSDSIAMALKFKAPIFISRSLFKERAVLLQEQKNVEESYGLTIQELNPMLAESFSFKEGKGVLIADVKGGSQAEKDGIQRGDILVEIGEQKIEDVAAMRSALAEIKGPAKVKIFRKGSFSTLTLNPANY